MDNNQIENISRNNPVTKHTFIGCFAQNKMPVKPENGYMIVNNESNPKKMGHWILIYKNNDKHYFFDSFGFHPSIYGGNIASYCNTYNNIQLLLKKPIQSNNSYVCGAYCLYVAYYLCKNISVEKIITRFSKRNLHNDKIVEKFIMDVSGNQHSCNKNMCGVLTFKTVCKNLCKC